MKNYLLLFLLIFSVTTQAQTYPPNPTNFGKITINTNEESTTSTKINVQEDNNRINWLRPINIPIPTVPVNYAPSTPTLGAHLTAIDTRLGQIGNTTAGITNRIFFTGDNVTVTAGTFFASNGSGKGTATSGLPTPLVNGDNQKQYFVKDLISIAQPSATTAPPGNYSGQLTVSSTPTPNGTFQRYTIEIYKTNNGGTPIASGITGAPTGNLGVTVVAILDSGQLNLVAGSITNISLNGNLASTLSLAIGERLRYHVSAQKVGTGGGNVTMSVLYGSNYNSYYDVTVTPKASTVINDSGVVGINVADALNTLNSLKANLANPIFTGSISSPNFLTGSNYTFPELFNYGSSNNFITKTNVKGNDNGTTSAYNSSLIITDSSDRPIFNFNNLGRLDLIDYSGFGATSVLCNYATTPISGLMGHYAFQARNSAGNRGTFITINGILIDNTASSIDTQLSFGYCDNLNTTSTIGQPNKFVRISAGGFVTPDIAFVSDSGIHYFSNKLTAEGDILSKGLRYTKSIDITGTNLNSLSIAGFYTGSSLTNAPLGSTDLFFITNEVWEGASTWSHQTATLFNTPGVGGNRIFSRVNQGGAWAAWKELAFTDNTTLTGTTTISSLAGTGTRLTLSQPDGTQIAGGLDSDYVKTTGNQTIGGVKTFTSQMSINRNTDSVSLVANSSSATAGSTSAIAVQLQGSPKASIFYDGTISGTNLVVSGNVTATAFNGVKTYTALVDQSSTGNPTTTILGNNTIGTIVWTRSTNGFYFGTLAGAFPAGKTYLSITPSSPTASYSIFRNTADQIVIRTQDNSTVPFTDADTKLFSNSIEIRVYP